MPLISESGRSMVKGSIDFDAFSGSVPNNLDAIFDK